MGRAIVFFKIVIIVSTDIVLTVDPVLAVGRMWDWFGGS